MNDSPAPLSPPPRVTIRGVPFSRVGEREAADYILACVKAGVGGVVLAANTDVLRICDQKPEVRAHFERATIVTPDGMPIMWAAKLQGQPLVERLPTSNLILTMIQAAEESDVSVFLLGGNEGVAEAAAERYRQLHPNLKVTGSHCPPFGFESSEAEMAKIREALRESEPDVVFVGLGVPKQERLIEALRGEFPATWFMATGISFSYAAGELKQAPRWLQALGLEWFFRLCQEPRRLFRRYILQDLPFLFPLLSEALRSRRRARA
ncbi:MAG TPA: WecB/TagA/CpsF family glycosyltransferase [Fimbriimonadaceae bacterium]|nr:WecB/TagA/CpsF family glycosyltransferase [Fimbriimonadaceae bacterium]